MDHLFHLEVLEEVQRLKKREKSLGVMQIRIYSSHSPMFRPLLLLVSSCDLASFQVGIRQSPSHMNGTMLKSRLQLNC